jgi:hypothetical protein
MTVANSWWQIFCRLAACRRNAPAIFLCSLHRAQARLQKDRMASLETSSASALVSRARAIAASALRTHAWAVNASLRLDASLSLALRDCSADCRVAPAALVLRRRDRASVAEHTLAILRAARWRWYAERHNAPRILHAR